MTEQNCAFPTSVTRVYQQVVGESSPLNGTTKQDAFTEAVSRLTSMVQSGEIVIDIEAAIRAELGRADDQQGRAADAVIKRISDGQDTLDPEDGDPMLDIVVKLGDGKRKPWRHITMDDLISMDSLRYKNYRAQQVAYDEWRQSFEHVRPVLAIYPTVGEAVQAGAFDHPEVMAA